MNSFPARQQIGLGVKDFIEDWMKAVDPADMAKHYTTTMVFVNSKMKPDRRRFSSVRRRKKVIMHNSRRVTVRKNCYPVNVEETDTSTKVVGLPAHLPSVFVYSAKGPI